MKLWFVFVAAALLLQPPIFASANYQCFQHKGAASYIEIDRNTGKFIAENCSTGYQLKGDGLLRFASRRDRSFTLTFDIVKDGDHHRGEFRFDEKTRQLVGEIRSENAKVIPLLRVSVIVGQDNDNCSRCQKVSASR